MYPFRNSGFTKEQLNNLGVTGKEPPVVAPTSLFPPLLSRPIEIDKNNSALDYKVVWKEEFRVHLFDVHSNSVLNLTDDSYSSKVAVSLAAEISTFKILIISCLLERSREGTQEENEI